MKPSLRSLPLSALLGLLLVFGGLNATGSPEADALVYEQEPNGNCDQAYSSGNVITDNGDTYAGTVTYSNDIATNDPRDYWDLGHHGTGVTFSAHFAAGGDRTNNVWVLDEECDAVCVYNDVGLSEDIDCTLPSSQHYYVATVISASGSVAYQYEFISFNDPPAPGCTNSNPVKQLLCEIGKLV